MYIMKMESIKFKEDDIKSPTCYYFDDTIDDTILNITL